MASKKRRGRPKGSKKKKMVKLESQPSSISPEVSNPENPEILPPKNSLLDDLRGVVAKVGNLLPAPGPTIESSSLPSPTQSPESAQGLTPGSVADHAEGVSPAEDFNRTVAQTVEEYSGSAAADSVGAPGGAESHPQNAVPVNGHFIDPRILLVVRRAAIKMMAKSNPLRDMSEAEIQSNNELDSAMVDEIGPKFFGQFENPCFWMWLTVNLSWFAATSPGLADSLGVLIGKMAGSFGTRKGPVS